MRQRGPVLLALASALLCPQPTHARDSDSIDGKVKAVGKIPKKEEILEWLKK